MGGARPAQFERDLIKMLDSACTVNDMVEAFEGIRKSIDMVQSGIDDLPPIHSLSQYVSDSNGHQHLFYSSRDAEGQWNPNFLTYPGGDAIAWLNSAYVNASEVLRILNEQGDSCALRLEKLKSAAEAIEASPKSVIDGRLAAISLCIHFFSDMTEADVLRVFDDRQGTLRMRSRVKWQNAIVVEAIRKGLNLQPRFLERVIIRHGDGTTESWIMDTDHRTNRCGMRVNTARVKGHDKYTSLDESLIKVTSQLQSLTG